MRPRNPDVAGRPPHPWAEWPRPRRSPAPLPSWSRRRIPLSPATPCWWMAARPPWSNSATTLRPAVPPHPLLDQPRSHPAQGRAVSRLEIDLAPAVAFTQHMDPVAPLQLSHALVLGTGPLANVHAAAGDLLLPQVREACGDVIPGHLVAVTCRHGEPEHGPGMVWLHATAPGIQGAQIALRHGIALSGRLIEQLEGTRIVLLHPSPVLVETAQVVPGRGMALLCRQLEPARRPGLVLLEPDPLQGHQPHLELGAGMPGVGRSLQPLDGVLHPSPLHSLGQVPLGKLDLRFHAAAAGREAIPLVGLILACAHTRAVLEHLSQRKLRLALALLRGFSPLMHGRGEIALPELGQARLVIGIYLGAATQQQHAQPNLHSHEFTTLKEKPGMLRHAGSGY